MGVQCMTITSTIVYKIQSDPMYRKPDHPLIATDAIKVGLKNDLDSRCCLDQRVIDLLKDRPLILCQVGTKHGFINLNPFGASLFKLL